jgi:pimeloyl-ACP methyl ester carboxylesterase
MAHHHEGGSALPPTLGIDLPDGRRLGYLEVGDPDGRPVVSNHGGLSSRLDVVPADAAARAHGLRIISPDRPGIGASTADDDRTLASWAADVGVLADRLGVDRFAVMGWSFGGGFAQGVAHHLADRVDALVLVASTIPRDWAAMRDDIDRMDRLLMRMSESGIGRLKARTLFHLMGTTARLAPRAFAKGAKVTGPSADAVVQAIGEGLTTTVGVVTDYQLMDRPGGFDPSDLTVATHIWQGDADDLVPPSWAARLHDAIAGSALTVVPGATHFLWYDHWDDIFAALSAAVPV